MRKLLLGIFLVFLFCSNLYPQHQIILGWNANTESDIAGYRVYYGQASRTYTSKIDAGNVLTYIISNLPDGIFYFAITAYDTSNNESGYSNEVVQTFSPIPPTNNPLVSYAFNEGTGSNFASSTGIGNGTLTNGATWSASGKYGPALNFNKVSAGKVLASSTINNLTAFTYCAWINPRSMGGLNDGRIIHKGSNTARKQLHMEATTTNGIELLVDRANGAADAITSNNVVPLNQWSYVCGTYSETDGPRVYVNGIQTGYSTRSLGSGATASDSVGDLWIGNRSTLDKGFDGLIDNLRIYNKIISTSDMILDMNTPISYLDIFAPNKPNSLTILG